MVVCKNCVRKFETYVQIHSREFLYELFTVCVKGFNAVFAIAKEVHNFLQGFSAGAIGRHCQGILKAEWRHDEVSSLIHLIKEAECHGVAGLHIALLRFCERYLCNLLRRSWGLEGYWVRDLYLLLAGNECQKAGGYTTNNGLFHFSVRISVHLYNAGKWQSLPTKLAKTVKNVNEIPEKARMQTDCRYNNGGFLPCGNTSRLRVRHIC